MSKKQGQALPYSVSQNFLTRSQTIRRLLRLTDLTARDTVLEIGAGKGHITRALADRCGQVISYEIDPALYQALLPRLPANVRLHGADFLRCTLPSKPYKVFANIPFSITTAIMRKLTTAAHPPEAMWLVMEKGAAKRFCGLPQASQQSLLYKPFYEMKIVYHFRREDFHPAPRVDVVLLQCIRRTAPDVTPTQRQAYTTFITHSLKYGLFGKQSLLTRRQIATALRLAGLPPIAPSGDVLYIQWLCLFRCWLRFGAAQK